MKETYEWTVTFSWEYDPEIIAKTARKIMENKKIPYDEALFNAVGGEICGEDDYLYYNFCETEMKDVVERVKELYPYNEQLKLF